MSGAVKVGDEWMGGMLIGRNAAMAEWRLRREIDDPDFVRLVWRLQAKKYWAAKSPERKARILAYRRQWRLDNLDRWRACVKAARKLWRQNAKNRAREALQKRARRAQETAQRRAELVYTCAVCGAQWCQLGRIPCRPPKYCSQSCRGKANYLRGKAQGKPWAMRDRAHRMDRS